MKWQSLPKSQGKPKVCQKILDNARENAIKMLALAADHLEQSKSFFNFFKSVHDLVFFLQKKATTELEKKKKTLTKVNPGFKAMTDGPSVTTDLMI